MPVLRGTRHSWQRRKFDCAPVASDSGAELIADKLRDWIGAQIEVVLSVERGTPIRFLQRPVKLVTS
jgi:hypothetical protein